MGFYSCCYNNIVFRLLIVIKLLKTQYVATFFDILFLLCFLEHLHNNVSTITSVTTKCTKIFSEIYLNCSFFILYTWGIYSGMSKMYPHLPNLFVIDRWHQREKAAVAPVQEENPERRRRASSKACGTGVHCGTECLGSTSVFLWAAYARSFHTYCVFGSKLYKTILSCLLIHFP